MPRWVEPWRHTVVIGCVCVCVCLSVCVYVFHVHFFANGQKLSAENCKAGVIHNILDHYSVNFGMT